MTCTIYILAPKFMNSDTESKDDADYDAAISQVSDFFEYMRKNRKSVPDEERIANKDKFIKTVEELSNTYKIDVDLEEFSKGYVAHIYLDYGCYNGYIKKLLAMLFILADDISFLDGKKEDADMLFSFTYHTSYFPKRQRNNRFLIMYPMATQLSSHLFDFPDTVWNF